MQKKKKLSLLMWNAAEGTLDGDMICKLFTGKDTVSSTLFLLGKPFILLENPRTYFHLDRLPQLKLCR